MAPQDPQAAALLAHVLSQIEDNVNFLASQDYISQADASAILTKLPNANNNRAPSGISGLASRVANMGTRSTPAAPSALPQAKALWAYSGDVVHITFLLSLSAHQSDRTPTIYLLVQGMS
jgi:hypothetical protein